MELDKLNDFQNFIIENKIINAHDFKTRFYTLYYKMISKNLSKDVYYFGKENELYIKNELSKYNSLDDFQKLIDNNNITRPSDFKKYNERLYRKMIRLGFNEKIKYSDIIYSMRTWKLKDFQEYIDKNNIQNPVDFYKTNKNIYEFLTRNHPYEAKNLIYPNRLLEKRESNVAKLNIIDKCKKLDYTFVNEATWTYGNALTKNIEIECNIDHNKWTTSYNSFIKQNHICKICMTGESHMEADVYSLLINDLKILDVVRNYSPEFLLKKSLDLYIPSLKLAIECQGDQHFIPVDWFGGVDGLKLQQLRDKEKYTECKNNGIVIVYYVDLRNIKQKTRMIIKDKYIDEIYTSINDLKNRILKEF